jgi:hypothetical protein
VFEGVVETEPFRYFVAFLDAEALRDTVDDLYIEGDVEAVDEQ